MASGRTAGHETGQDAAAVPRSRLRRALRLLERALAVVGAILLAYHAGFDVFQVISPSMAPAVRGDGYGNDNDWVLTERVSLGVATPRRFGIVTSSTRTGSWSSSGWPPSPASASRSTTARC